MCTYIACMCIYVCTLHICILYIYIYKHAANNYVPPPYFAYATVYIIFSIIAAISSAFDPIDAREAPHAHTYYVYDVCSYYDILYMLHDAITHNNN